MKTFSGSSSRNTEWNPPAVTGTRSVWILSAACLPMPHGEAVARRTWVLHPDRPARLQIRLQLAFLKLEQILLVCPLAGLRKYVLELPQWDSSRRRPRSAEHEVFASLVVDP